MGRFLLKRIGQALFILWGVTVVTFILSYLIPADPVRMIAGRSASADTVASIRQQLGLDQPLPVQYARYLSRLVQGDLGRSYVQKTNVSELIASRLPATLLLMAGAIFFELLLGLSAGLIAATQRGRATDQTVMVLSFVGVSAPQFVVGLLLLYVFAYLLDWFPLGGYGTFSHLILPALTLGITGAGWYSRMTRSATIDVLRQDYIRTARAKGLGEWAVTIKHVFRNALIGVVATLGFTFVGLVSEAVVTETVFALPGIGRLVVQSILRRDYPVIQGVILVVMVFYILVNLLVDIVTTYLDPRVKAQ